MLNTIYCTFCSLITSNCLRLLNFTRVRLTIFFEMKRIEMKPFYSPFVNPASNQKNCALFRLFDNTLIIYCFKVCLAFKLLSASFVYIVAIEL